MKGKVYVVNAYVPNGGTLMAYHMAVILHRDFGYEVCVLTDQHGPDHGIFVYDPVFETKPLADIGELITSRDVLICNPSFSPIISACGSIASRSCMCRDSRPFR